MRNTKGYKIAIFILSVIIVIQGIYILKRAPKKEAKPKAAAPVKVVTVKGKIAIVLDDWGYNLNNLPALENIKAHLTLSILPNLSHSREVAEEAHSRGFEIILHLPMEPRENYRLEKDTIMTSMDGITIRNIIEQDLINVPYVKGVSNHMGSKATSDTKTMTVVLSELKKRHLYFLDSFVSSGTVCADIARKIRVPFIKRDVFLDNQPQPAYIKGQINQLKSRARRFGYAVGIGHDRKNTLEVLREVIPQLEKEGYRFVFVSELVK